MVAALSVEIPATPSRSENSPLKQPKSALF